MLRSASLLALLCAVAFAPCLASIRPHSISHHRRQQQQKQHRQSDSRLLALRGGAGETAAKKPATWSELLSQNPNAFAIFAAALACASGAAYLGFSLMSVLAEVAIGFGPQSREELIWGPELQFNRVTSVIMACLVLYCSVAGFVSFKLTWRALRPELCVSGAKRLLAWVRTARSRLNKSIGSGASVDEPKRHNVDARSRSAPTAEQGASIVQTLARQLGFMVAGATTYAAGNARLHEAAPQVAFVIYRRCAAKTDTWASAQLERVVGALEGSTFS